MHAIPYGASQILLLGVTSKGESPSEVRIFDLKENTFTFTYRLEKEDQEGVELTGPSYINGNGIIFAGRQDKSLCVLNFSLSDLKLSTYEELQAA